MSDTLKVAVAEGIATLTLNRPDQRNALSLELRREITTQLRLWHDDSEVRIVVLGAEGSAFCAGFDLSEFGQADLVRQIRHNSAEYHRVVWGFPKPIVAAVNGPALGGGFDLATLCDLRIASTDAAFGHPEIKFGAPPLFTPLRWIVGHGVARDLCLTGRRIGADEALSYGLVSRVVAAGDLAEQAQSVARQIAKAPQPALEVTKCYLTDNAGMGFDEAFRIEHDDVFDRLLTGGTGPAAP